MVSHLRFGQHSQVTQAPVTMLAGGHPEVFLEPFGVKLPERVVMPLQAQLVGLVVVQAFDPPGEPGFQRLC